MEMLIRSAVDQKHIEQLGGAQANNVVDDIWAIAIRQARQWNGCLFSDELNAEVPALNVVQAIRDFEPRYTHAATVDAGQKSDKALADLKKLVAVIRDGSWLVLGTWVRIPLDVEARVTILLAFSRISPDNYYYVRAPPLST
jgi:hypothetical protein